MDVLLFYFEFVYVWSCWVFFAPQALLQLCRAETPGAVLGGSLGVLPSCGRGFSVAALLWAGFAGVLPSCGPELLGAPASALSAGGSIGAVSGF